MDNKKKFINIGIIVIVIMTVTVGMFVWKYKKNQLELTRESQEYNQKNNKSENNIKEVTSYKNPGYSYGISIPSGFSIKTGSTKDPDSLVNIISEQDGMPLFFIGVEISKFKNVDTWLSNYQQKISRMTSYEGVKIDPPTILSKEKIFVDSIEAIKLNINNMPYTDYSVTFIKDKFIYTVSYNGLLQTNERDVLKGQLNNEKKLRSEFQLKHRIELDEIIKSFKFFNDKIEEVSFCGKIFNTEIINLNNIDIIKRIAILSQNNKYEICKNISINSPDGKFSSSIKKQNHSDADYKDGIYFVTASVLNFKIDVSTNDIYILGALAGEPTLIGKLK